MRRGAPERRGGGGATPTPNPSCFRWVNLGVDGTKRWSKTYVHATIGSAFDPSVHLTSWWVFQGPEKWASLRVFATKMDGSQQVRLCRALKLPVAGQEVPVRLFLLADGKGVCTSPLHTNGVRGPCGLWIGHSQI